jgi:hypothetical protein
MSDEEMDLQTNLSLREIVLAEAGEAAVYVVDRESADRATDYELHLAELDRISNGALAPSGFRCTDGDPREVVVLRGARPEIVLTLAEENGWIDAAPLARQLNAALADEGSTSLFHVFSSKDFGQEIGFVYLPKVTGERFTALVRERMEREIFEDFSS